MGLYSVKEASLPIDIGEAGLADDVLFPVRGFAFDVARAYASDLKLPTGVNAERIGVSLGCDFDAFQSWLTARSLSLEGVVSTIATLMQQPRGVMREQAAWGLPLNLRLALAAVTAQLPISAQREIGMWLPCFALAHYRESPGTFRYDGVETRLMQSIPVTEEKIELSRGWDLRPDELVVDKGIGRSLKMLELLLMSQDHSRIQGIDVGAILKENRKSKSERKGATALKDEETERVSFEWRTLSDRNSTGVRRDTRRSAQVVAAGAVQLPSGMVLTGTVGLDVPVGLVMKFDALPLAVMGFFPESFSSCSIVQLQKADFDLWRNDKSYAAAGRNHIPVLPAVHWAQVLRQVGCQLLTAVGFDEIHFPAATPENMRRFGGRDIEVARVASTYDASGLRNTVADADGWQCSGCVDLGPIDSQEILTTKRRRE